MFVFTIPCQYMRNFNLHGHCSLLQDLVLVPPPRQSEIYPSVVFIWLKHCLCLVWIPLPHDLVHSDHEDQSFQVASVTFHNIKFDIIRLKCNETTILVWCVSTFK